MAEGESDVGILAAVVVAIVVAWLVAARLLLALLPRPTAAASKETSVTPVAECASSDELIASSAGESGLARRRGTAVGASPTPASPPSIPPRRHTPLPLATPDSEVMSAGWPDKPLVPDIPQSPADGATCPAGAPTAFPSGEGRRRLLARRRQLISRLYDPSEDAAHILSLYFRPPSRPSSRPASRHVSRERDAAGTPRRRSAPSTPAPASPRPAAARMARSTYGDGLAGTGRGCGGPDTYSDDSGISVDDQHQQVRSVAGDDPACLCSLGFGAQQGLRLFL